MAHKKSITPNISEETAVPENGESKAFNDFVAEEIKALYWCGQQQLKWYTRLQKAVSNSSFAKLLADEAVASNLQAEKMEQVFECLGENARSKKSLAFESVMEEAARIMEEKKKRSPVRDTLLLLMLQKAALFLQASYEVVIQAAGKSGNEEIVHLLEENKKMGENSINLFVSLAEELKVINETAPTLPGEEEEEPEVAAVYDSINLTGKTKPQ